MDLWTEDELFELAKRVHAPPKPSCPSPPALKVLCLNLTINMWETWTDLYKERGINSFDKLLPTLRNNLIDHLTSAFSVREENYQPINLVVNSCEFKCKEFLLLLLNTQTKSLRLDKSIACVLKDFPSFLAQVVEKAPNLELFSFDLYEKTHVTSKRRISILNEIVQMKSLKHLDFIGYFPLDNDDLIVVANNLRNLVCLKLSLDARLIRLFAFRNISNLKKLKLFQFEFLDEHNHDILDMKSSAKSWIYSWCAQHLPQLKEIKTNKGTTVYPEKIIPLFSGTSSLEVLQSAYFLPEANLPNLQELTFHGEIKDTEFFTKIYSYTYLRSLELFKIRVEEFYQIIEFFGKQLTSLTFVGDDPSDFDFFKVVHLCPNLAKLCIHFRKRQSQVKCSKFQERVSSKNFEHLESFTCDIDLPDGVLKSIIYAPLIKIIKVADYTVRKEDCKLVLDDEARFKRLEHVEFRRLRKGPGCTLDDLGLMVKLLVCGSPNLKVVDMQSDVSDVDLNQDPTGANKFVKLLKAKSK